MKPQDKKKLTEADALRSGEELALDATGYIGRGEAIPPELEAAISEWQSHAFLLAQQSEQESASAWWNAYVGFESTLNKAIDAQGMPDMGTFVGVGAGGQAMPPPLVAPFKAPKATPSMEAAEMQLSGETLQRASILTSPLVPQDDGTMLIRDEDGMEWDLTEHIADLSRPEVQKRLRQSLMGMFPSDSDVAAHTGGAMPTLGLVQQGAHKIAGAVTDSVPGSIRYVKTASPGLELPWLVPLGAPQAQGIPWRGDEAELARDPLWTRALMEVIGTIDTKPTGWETFMHGLAGVADFMLLAKGTGALAGGVGKVASAAIPKGAPLRMLGPLVMKAAPAVDTLSRFPLNAPLMRTAAAFSAYEGVTQSTNPHTTLLENLQHGFAQGLVFGAAHKLAAVGRTVIGKAGQTKIGKPIATAMAQLTPQRLRQTLTAGASARDSEVLMSRLRQFTAPTLTKALEREAMAPATKEALKGVSDAYWMGVLVHSYGEAQAAPEGEGFSAFWRGLFSKNSHATGAAFALNGVLQYGASVRPEVHKWLKSEAGMQLQDGIARKVAHPDARQPLRDAYDLFTRWREKEPEVFSGIDFRSPEKPAAKERPALEEQRPPDAAAAFKQMQVDEPSKQTATMGEFHPEKLRILLGSKAKSDAGVFKHGLNAVNEYLRVFEGADGEAYNRWSDVPQALVRRVLDWRDAGKLTPKQMRDRELSDRLRKMIGEAREDAEVRAIEAAEDAIARSPLEAAHETLREVDGVPAYDGLAPLEKVAKAQATKRRPTLGRALELVANGERDAAWLRETFPEGAAQVKDGPLESWAGSFERGVRATWKAQSTARLRSSSAARAKPKTLQDFVATEGGIRFSGDLANLTRKEAARADKRTVVYSEKSGKGMNLDDMGEKAWEAGFFPAGRPTEREMIDALHENILAPDAESSMHRQHERDLARQHGEQLAAYRDEIESQRVEMPATEEALLEVYAGDARFIGMEPARLRREIEQLRAQTEAGDPGAMLASPPPTPTSSARLAIAKVNRVVEWLQDLDLLSTTTTPDSNAAMEAVARLARGESAPPNVDPKVWTRLQEDARIARDSLRDAMRRSMEGTWDDTNLRGLEDAWTFLDAFEAGREIDPALRERVKPWLDESGRPLTAWLDRLQQEAGETLRNAIAAESLGESSFSSLVPPVAFSGRKFTNVEENAWGQRLTSNYWLDKPEVQQLLGTPWAYKLFRGMTEAIGNPIVSLLNLGPISRPQSTRTRSIMEHQMLRMAMARGDAEKLRIVAATVGPMLSAPWGGRRPPQAELDFFSNGMESGFFSRAKGPADLEAARPGSGYMWPIYERTRDLFEIIARDQLALGRMTEAQIAKHGGGKYLGHYFVREQMEGEAAELRAGRIPIKWQGRSMLREDGMPSHSEPVLPIRDPVYAVNRGTWEQTQSIRVFKALREVADDPMASLTLAQVKELGLFDQADYVRAAVRPPPPLTGETVYDAVRRAASTHEHPTETYLLGARIAAMLDQMSAPGKTEPGKIPYSEEGARYLKKLLGEGQDGHIYIPRPLGQELEIAVSDAFVIPGEGFGAGLTAAIDLGTSFTKRGLTTLRPSNWSLNIGGNVFRNHANGGVPMQDWMAGMVGRPSFTRDGMDGMRSYLRWISELAPSEKPAGWSEKEWNDLDAAQRFLRLSGPSTSAFVTLGPELATSIGRAFERPDVTRDAWMRQIDEAAEAGGWSEASKQKVALQAQAMTARMMHGLEGFDAKILEWTGSSDPVGSAKALNALSSLWHMTDLFMFKYPAYLKARHEWPLIPMDRVVHYALSRTSNAMDTHPRMRRYLSMRAPWHDKLWKAAQGSDARAYGKIAMASLLRGRFWTDAATMVPMAVRNAGAHPFRTLSTAALAASVPALLLAMQSEEERRRFQEEAATAKSSVINWPTSTTEDEAALKEFGSYLGNHFGGAEVTIPPWAAKGAVDFWRRFQWKDPTAFQAPDQAGETRIGSLMDLPPIGQAIRQGQGLYGIVKGAVGAGESPERAAQFTDGVERLFGLQAQAAAQAVLGIASGDTKLADVFSGGSAGRQAIAGLMFQTLGTAGFGYPTLGMFSREGKFIGETVFLDGQSWNQYLRGIRRDPGAGEAGENLAGAALKTLWPTRSLQQRPPLKTPVDGWTAILAEMYPGYQASTEDGRVKMQAHKWVTEQMSVLIPDLLELYQDRYPEPDSAEIPFDEYVAGAIRETLDYTIQPAGELGPWIVEPGHKPETVLLQALAGLPERDRSATIGHLREWVTRERFQEDGMAFLLEAGQRLEMPKAVFREAFRNALLDPSGTNLVRWWWSQAKDADEETLGYLSPLIYDIQIPAEGTEAFKDYLRLMQRYQDFGLQWPPVPDAVSTEMLVKKGVQRAVQGGEAFRRVLHESPERHAFDTLLAPR